ncbi:MAG: SDR family oxidoreductase [Methylotenera sp.]|nr:SDR family oxidoreductase [Oligoflexia bacterium]
MRIQLKKIKDQVIVITGASSGIGLCTAQRAAAKGACVVLASRNEADLKRITQQIKETGGRATYVVADVAVLEDVERIGDAAIDEFGRIDTWVNNAGVSIYGRLTEVKMSDKRRLFDVNFWGTVNGCKVAVPHLKATGGAIINIGSVLSERVIPLQGIYCASKHAVKAYTDGLRMELEAAGFPIAVTLVKPAAIDTPYPEHAKNYMEGQPTHTPPVYHPEVVARAILNSAVHRQRSIFAGGSGVLFSFMEKFMPRTTDLMMERNMMESGQSRDSMAYGEDILVNPGKNEGKIRGRYEGHVMRSSLYTKVASDPKNFAVLLGAVAVVGTLWLTRRSWMDGVIEGYNDLRQNRLENVIDFDRNRKTQEVA